MARSKVFVSYSHKDQRWLDSLREHLGVLEQEGLIDVFADTQIGAGNDWFNAIHEEMSSARLALLLVSASFLTSSFIRKEEVPRLFEQHEAAGMGIYPLLVRDCAWQEVGWLSRLQIRPPDAKPVESKQGSTRQACLANVAREIASIIRTADQRGFTTAPAHSGEKRTERYSEGRAGTRADNRQGRPSQGDLEILRQIAFARGQRISSELLGERIGTDRCVAALASLERDGLIRSFTIEGGKRYAATELGRQMLVKNGVV